MADTKPAAKQRRKPTPAEVAEGIVQRKKIVRVDGKKVELHVPDEAGGIRARERLTDNPDSADPGRMLRVAGAAVAACMDGVDAELGTRLVMATGGESGPVAEAALDLCGLGKLIEAFAEGVADRPT
ncbi:hypothetical protein [Candidatus Palauibacter sp.]|uniref:hypothetical protein n=1 Tax=Candidatus Palauibacter sp. TaxID=3101350 RepID=UPI003CC5409D